MINEKPDWLTLYSWDDVFSSKRSNIHKLHAKIIQFTLPTRTILLSGSANVTNAAFNGAGDEACIAIIGESNKNYIKDLGIILNHNSVANALKLDALAKPDRIPLNFDAKNVHIISSELIDDTLTVIINRTTESDCSLQILDFNGNVLQIYDISTDNYIIQIKDYIPTNCIAVIIDANHSEISNRSLIINEEDVARFNPNKLIRKLDSLLESNIDWKDNLASIISYLWFDSSEGKLANTKAVSTSIKEEAVGKSVSSEEFDDIRVGSRQTVLSLPEVRILDFLLSSEKTQGEIDKSDNSDDLDSLQDVDDGHNDYNNSEHIMKQRQQGSAFITCIDNYSRRLRKHYDIRLSELFSKATKYGADIFKYDMCNVNVMDYSRILIDIVLMWRELNIAIDNCQGNIHNDFLTNMGKFLLLARKGYVKANDYAWHKCVELHKELSVFCLLIIASQDWYGKKEATTVKLIILNLLHTCSKSNAINLDEVTEVFKKKIIELNVATKPSSINLINKTLTEYNLFYPHREDSTTIRELDFNNPNGNYSYRRGYGFFYVTDIKSIHQKALNNTVYEMSLYHPGFDEIIKVIGGKKVSINSSTHCTFNI